MNIIPAVNYGKPQKVHEFTPGRERTSCGVSIIHERWVATVEPVTCQKCLASVAMKP